jgi:hypothetical protein
MVQVNDYRNRCTSKCVPRGEFRCKLSLNNSLREASLNFLTGIVVDRIGDFAVGVDQFRRAAQRIENNQLCTLSSFLLFLFPPSFYGSSVSKIKKGTPV